MFFKPRFFWISPIITFFFFSWWCKRGAFTTDTWFSHLVSVLEEKKGHKCIVWALISCVLQDISVSPLAHTKCVTVTRSKRPRQPNICAHQRNCHFFFLAVMNKEDFITAAWGTCRIMALSAVRWHWKVRFWHSYWNFLCSLVCMTALSSMQKKKSYFDFSWDIWVCNQEPLNAKMQDWRAFQKKPCVNNKFCCKNLNNSHVQFWSVSFLNSITICVQLLGDY